MLADLQSWIEGIYQADCGERLADYLITDRAVANSLSAEPLASSVEETVLVSRNGDDLALSVFLDQALLERMAAHDPMNELHPAMLADLAVILEGISHFNYIAFSAKSDREVTLLELELQAEVDKFVTTTLLALQQNDIELTRRLHCWLFDDVSFRSSLSPAERERYRTANDYAARFCYRLRQRLGSERALQELRHFYRLSQAQKLSHIHSTAWRKGSPS